MLASASNGHFNGHIYDNRPMIALRRFLREFGAFAFGIKFTDRAKIVGRHRKEAWIGGNIICFANVEFRGSVHAVKVGYWAWINLRRDDYLPIGWRESRRDPDQLQVWRI